MQSLQSLQSLQSVLSWDVLAEESCNVQLKKHHCPPPSFWEQPLEVTVASVARDGHAGAAAGTGARSRLHDEVVASGEAGRGRQEEVQRQGDSSACRQGSVNECNLSKVHTHLHTHRTCLHHTSHTIFNR